VCYFFHNADVDKNTPLAAARVLVHQLLQTGDPGSRENMLADLSSHINSGGQPRALNFRKLWKSFCRHCARFSGPIILLDGLDECTHVNPLITGLFQLVRTTETKIIATSRYEPEPRKELEAVPGINADPKEVSHDIKAFLE
jgi:hypothetical protein